MNRITPSKPDYWRGTPQDAFTVEQHAGIARRNVESAFAQKRQWAGRTFDVAVVFEEPEPMNRFMVNRVTKRFTCPLLATTPTGRLVICPNGMQRWIDRDHLNP